AALTSPRAEGSPHMAGAVRDDATRWFTVRGSFGQHGSAGQPPFPRLPPADRPCTSRHGRGRGAPHLAHRHGRGATCLSLPATAAGNPASRSRLRPRAGTWPSWASRTTHHAGHSRRWARSHPRPPYSRNPADLSVVDTGVRTTTRNGRGREEE